MSLNTYVYGVTNTDFEPGQQKTYRFEGRVPTKGSLFFLFKVAGSQGVFGKAQVISSTNNEVTFETIEKREVGFQIPAFVLRNSFPNELWPKNFVCKLHIPVLCDIKLPELWEASRDKHCIEQIYQLMVLMLSRWLKPSISE